MESPYLFVNDIIPLIWPVRCRPPAVEGWRKSTQESQAAAARRAGRTGGRPPKLTDDDIEAATAMLANPDIAVTQIAQRLAVSPATLYHYIPAARTANTRAFDNGRSTQ
jgi:DNA invertase Pin-like site-specific DNA recombinase